MWRHRRGLTKTCLSLWCTALTLKTRGQRYFIQQWPHSAFVEQAKKRSLRFSYDAMSTLSVCWQAWQLESRPAHRSAVSARVCLSVQVINSSLVHQLQPSSDSCRENYVRNAVTDYHFNMPELVFSSICLKITPIAKQCPALHKLEVADDIQSTRKESASFSVTFCAGPTEMDFTVCVLR